MGHYLGVGDVEFLELVEEGCFIDLAIIEFVEFNGHEFLETDDGMVLMVDVNAQGTGQAVFLTIQANQLEEFLRMD